MLGCARVYLDVRGCARVCTSDRRCAWVCAGVHGCSVCVCAGVCGCAGCAQLCAGVRRFAQEYACMCGMNFQNFFRRIESLHQRTLIRILYEFFKLNFGGKYFDVIISCWFGNLIAFIHISSFPFHGSFSYDFASQLISQKICFHINHNKSF